jgi:hypothetical protein
MNGKIVFAALVWVLLSLAGAADLHAGGYLFDQLGLEMHGYAELRGGARLQDDPEESDLSVMEARMQLELQKSTHWLDLKYKGDVWADGVSEQGEYDTRELWAFIRPLDMVDVKIGRQILTWGTGDLVFLNDLFPKDWRSFFIGRNAEYLKAPSDAAKVSLFTEICDIDLVYTPRFDPDRFITGDYVSYWNGERVAGQGDTLDALAPDDWFEDDEIAFRLSRTVSGYELAAYGYDGFWKTPTARSDDGQATFSRLRSLGASLRGQVGQGIGNVEFAWYHSLDDTDGRDPAIPNSELRYLVGYSREIVPDCTATLQYYVEQMLDYGGYRRSSLGGSLRDEWRHVLTLQLVQLLMNQNLELALSAYYCPSDQDAYLRPTVQYKCTDHLTLECGANIFLGERRTTFFGQFDNNTNLYLAVRYSF